MQDKIINTAIFLFVLYFGVYGFLCCKFGFDLIKGLFKKISKKRSQLINNPEIDKLLTKLNYKYFEVVESPVAFGLAHPFGKKVVISSKIYNSGNFNLIQYVLTHEISHKKLSHTKILTFLYSFVTVIYLFLYSFLKFPLWLTFMLGLLISRIFMQIQRKFEDQTDLETAKILGKNRVQKAIHDIFTLNRNPLTKRKWYKQLFLINRDYPSRIKALDQLRQTHRYKS